MLNQLTGLRYFAALLVFLSHSDWSNSNFYIEKIFKSGFVGVSFFFVLSGFVLSYSYHSKISSGVLSFNKFVMLRLARLTPLHYLTAIPLIIIETKRTGLDLTKILSNLLYIQSWIPNSNYYFSYNAPSWSLSNEMFFYILFFFIVAYSTLRLIIIFSVLLIIIFLTAIFSIVYFKDFVLFGVYTFSHWMFAIFPICRLIEFLAGIILYKIYKKKTYEFRYMAIFSYITLALSMYYANEIPEEFRFSLFFLPPIILFFYAHLNCSKHCFKFYSSKIMILLGNASFAFYLIHVTIIFKIKRVVSGFQLSDFELFAIGLIMTTLISILIYATYEKISERYLKSLIK